MNTVVEITNLTKDYEVGFWRKRKMRAVDDLSLTVEEGEVFGFLGANGAGKSTTLKLLMRLMYPTSGSAQILDRDISDAEMHRHIGYLPEHPYFYDYLTAREFIHYCAELFGYNYGERRTLAAEMLARVKLEERSWDKPLRRFSKGMLQRVGLAQALVNNPKIVFLDEPMSGLDPVGRREVRDLIVGLQAAGTTVFLCSHILADIEILCDRVAILSRGRLAHLGTLAQLRDLHRDGEGTTQRRMEIIVAGANVNQLEEKLHALDEAHVQSTANGARVEVATEADVDFALALIRGCGGQLVSVQTVGSALEDLFVHKLK